MSIADKLTQLAEIRTDIRDALTDKGISASNHDYADFAQDIASIPSGGGDNDIILPTQLNLYNELKMFELSNDPADYTKVDWIESRNGAYIVVDVKRNGQNVSCEAEFEVINTGGTAFIFGFGDDTSNQYGGCLLGHTTTQWSLLEPGISYNNFGTATLGLYTATLSLSGNTATVSGDMSYTKSSSNWSTSASYNNKPSILGYSATTPIRIKKAKYVKAGNIESQVYACYHTDTGYLGVFDSVKNKFYTGSGDFVKPSDTSNEINLATYLNSLGGN